LAAAAGTAAQERPFTLEGRTWVSQQAFIDAGLRCGTRDPDAIRAAQIDAFPARRSCDAAEVGIAVAGGNVDVHVHVIKGNSSGV
jgi:predicted amidohydrolase